MEYDGQPQKRTPKVFKYIKGTAYDISPSLIKSLKEKLPVIINDKGLIYVLDILNRSISGKNLFRGSQESRSRVRLQNLKNRKYGFFASNSCSSEFERLGKTYRVRNFVFLKTSYSIEIIKKTEKLIIKLLDKIQIGDINMQSLLTTISILHTIISTSHPYQDGNGRTILSLTKMIFELLQNEFELDLVILDEINQEYNNGMYWCTINLFPDSLLSNLWDGDCVIDYVEFCDTPILDQFYNKNLTDHLINIVNLTEDIIDEKKDFKSLQTEYTFFYESILELEIILSKALVKKRQEY